MGGEATLTTCESAEWLVQSGVRAPSIELFDDATGPRLVPHALRHLLLSCRGGCHANSVTEIFKMIQSYLGRLQLFTLG